MLGVGVGGKGPGWRSRCLYSGVAAPLPIMGTGEEGVWEVGWRGGRGKLFFFVQKSSWVSQLWGLENLLEGWVISPYHVQRASLILA